MKAFFVSTVFILLCTVSANSFATVSYEDDNYKSKFDALYKKLQTQMAATPKGKYEFSPEIVQNMAKTVANMVNSGTPVYTALQSEFNTIKNQHGKKVASSLHWIFNEAGNVIGEVALIYASPNEYLLFFGTPVGATGFSGRYNHVDIWDCTVAGRMADWTPGEMASTYLPGQCEYLAKGVAKGFIMEPSWNNAKQKYEGSFTIEYARGSLITAMPFGVFAPLGLTLDYKTAYQILMQYADLVLRSSL